VIADLRPYPEYKESGLPWLGQVPGHWETRRLRHACEMRVSNVDKQTKQGETPVRLCNYVEVYKNERIRESTRFMSASASEDERIRFCLRRGDVLITKDSEQWNDIGVPSLVEFEAPDLVCGYHLAILRARPPLHGPFLHRALECHFIAAQFHVEANGVTRYGLSHGAIQGVSIPLPPPAEQAAIVRFLDWANGRLERAIRAKRKVIALLNEQKQAIIHRAVTRGLDPSVPLKPSGISWLGDIPAHWKTPLFGRLLTRIEQGWSPVAAEGELASDQWAVLTLSAVRRGVFNPSAIKPVSWTVSIPTGIEVDDGDLLLTRSNTRDRVGDVCIARGARPRTLLCDLIYRVRLREGAIVPEFLVYELLSRVGRGQIERDARGSSGTMPKISQGHIKSWRIVLPPIEEQERIIERIEADSSPLNLALSRLEREIELLREYRTRLVADVVTGKLDVSDAASRLPEAAAPDAAEEPAEGLDETELADEEAAV
jgi:type I restriction enzyme S subunit